MTTTTGTVQPGDVVIADELVFRQDNQNILAAPTVVGPHGGRKVDTAALPNTVNPTLIQQPAPGSNYATDPMPVTGGFIAHPNDSFAFANNPRDPAFSPTTGDRANPSVLYQGPESLISPTTTLGVRTTPQAAENNGSYKNGLGNAIPFFSHAQVLIVRTERLPAPETRDGTLSQFGTAIYCVDWATRTVIWRFPDRTHLPGNATFGGSRDSESRAAKPAHRQRQRDHYARRCLPDSERDRRRRRLDRHARRHDSGR